MFVDPYEAYGAYPLHNRPSGGRLAAGIYSLYMALYDHGSMSSRNAERK